MIGKICAECQYQFYEARFYPRNPFTRCLTYDLNHFDLYADNFLPLNVRSAYLNQGSRKKKKSRRKPPKSCQQADKEVVSVSLCAFKRWDYHCSRYLSTSFSSYSLFCKKDLPFSYRPSLYHEERNSRA